MKLDRSLIFKKAHQLAKLAHQPGDDYQVTFAAALKMVYRRSHRLMARGYPPEPAHWTGSDSQWVSYYSSLSPFHQAAYRR